MTDRRQEILDAALAIADERGIDAVSMRAVADRVGVTSMALYPHVGDKAGLLDGLVGRLLGQVIPPDPALPWRDRLRAFARSMHVVALAHPTTTQLLFSRPAVTADAVRVVDLIYQALLEAGVPADQVPRVERLVSTALLGYVVSETGGRFGPGDVNPRARRAQLPDVELPGHHALARWLDEVPDWAAEFEADVEDLLRLVETIAAASV
jgi:AcrR family transcriptional regulator